MGADGESVKHLSTREVKRNRIRIVRGEEETSSSWLRASRIFSASAFVIVIAVVWVTALAPVGIRKRFIKATATSFWSEHQRLTKLLALGMSPAEVQNILGEADQRLTLTNGECWAYSETGPTAGGNYVVEFRREGGSSGSAGALRLCYIQNVEHRFLPNSEQFQMGEKLYVPKPDASLVIGLKEWPNLDTNQERK